MCFVYYKFYWWSLLWRTVYPTGTDCPITKFTGNHPLQTDVKFPTALTTLLDGTKWLTESPMSAKCWGPPKQMLAPQSGNNLRQVSTREGMTCANWGSGFGEKGIRVASISWIGASLLVVKVSSWLYMTWAISALIDATLLSCDPRYLAG